MCNQKKKKDTHTHATSAPFSTESKTAKSPYTGGQRRDESVYRFQTDQVHVQNRNKKKKTIIDLSFVMTTTEMCGGNLAPFIQTDLTHHVMLHQSQYF